MKKIVICLFSIISLISCNVDSEYSASIEEANNNMEIELIYNNEFGGDNLGKKSNPPFQRIYIFKFKNHRYIDFDGFRRCGIIHDPDCWCFNK